MNNIIELKSFLSSEEVQLLNDIVKTWTPIDYIQQQGRWPGELVAKQSFHIWDPSDQLADMLTDRINSLIGQHKVVEVTYSQLYLPWDIHCDYDRTEKGSEIYYAVLIPLQDYPCSRTILFDQVANYNHFYMYKQTGPKAHNPVDIDFWKNNLSHCWDDDREYLSLRYVGQPQFAGDLIAFPRNVWHSSDDFHTRMTGPKRFLQILTDKV
jgi:hypothetical protein